MFIKSLSCLFLVTLAIGGFVASTQAEDKTDKKLTERIANILIECKKITAGTTRAELLKVFTTEGGLSQTEHRTYVHRSCPYIKVDVDFTLSKPKQTEELPTDSVKKIS